MATREEMIMSLCPMVGRVAHTFPPPYEDRVQEGMIGAIEAVDHFDGRGSLVGWAHKRVRGAILDGMRHNDIVGRQQRREITQAQHQIDADPQGASVGLRARAQNPQLVGMTPGIERIIGDEDPGMVGVENRIDLVDAMEGLSEREREVVVAYYWDGRTLIDIAADTGVTESRISQIMVGARRHLRKTLTQGSRCVCVDGGPCASRSHRRRKAITHST